MAIDEQVTLKEFFTSIIQISDQRFEDRYESLEKLINKNSQEAKEAVKSALDAQEKAVNAALAAAEKAVQKAEIAAEKRFDNFAQSYSKDLERISQDLKALGEYKSSHNGKDEGIKNTGTLIAASFAIIISVGSVVIDLFKK